MPADRPSSDELVHMLTQLNSFWIKTSFFCFFRDIFLLFFTLFYTKMLGAFGGHDSGVIHYFAWS
jgi:hypothetical protein